MVAHLTYSKELYPAKTQNSLHRGVPKSSFLNFKAWIDNIMEFTG